LLNFLKRVSIKELQLSQIVTLLVGIFAILLAEMQNVLKDDALLLRIYGFWIIHPRTRCFILEEKSSYCCFWVCFWRATTILLIITENKLPLGVKLPEHLDANIYGISIPLLFVTISTYHNNKRETKWNSK
jgi:SSS family solute:Na+ symporter